MMVACRSWITQINNVQRLNKLFDFRHTINNCKYVHIVIINNPSGLVMNAVTFAVRLLLTFDRSSEMSIKFNCVHWFDLCNGNNISMNAC